jgi:formamidopyrimidine-DNA glycosylase
VPELPEVETVVRVIRPLLVGKTISAAKFFVPRQLLPQTPRGVSQALNGSRIQAVNRRGKYILIETERGILLIHLRMTGRLYVRHKDEPGSEYERATFDIDNGQEQLIFHDPRTLGVIQFIANDSQNSPLDKMGWEPLETAVHESDLKEKLKARRMAIKPVLLDQKLWAGIGNIYASEICFEAGVNPRKSANRLTKTERLRLIEAVPKVLERALKKGGTTLRNFASPDGIPGAYQKEFRVYDRENEPCPRCRNPIFRIVQAQRSSYFCKRCQK